VAVEFVDGGTRILLASAEASGGETAETDGVRAEKRAAAAGNGRSLDYNEK
jgi:hypothetical protein